jgi:hypothetical protein
MTAAFAVAAAVAVIAVVMLVLTTRRGTARLAAEQSRTGESEASLRACREACAEVEHRLEEQQLALATAQLENQRLVDARIDEAVPDGPGDVPPPAAEKGVGGDQGDRKVVAASAAEDGPVATEGGSAGEALWELERLRLEREWAEVSGTAAPLPEPWDGTIRAAVAVELEIIREVVGIPTQLEPDGAPPLDPVTALGAARLIAELLRSLARIGEEIEVAFTAEREVTASIATDGDGTAPDLGRLTAAATGLGASLAVVPTAGGLQARLRLPAHPA